jgi:inactivated superfamily I helicase
MPLSDPNLLDAVRRLRQYMSSLDNTQAVLESISSIDDKQVVDLAFNLTPKISNVAREISSALKIIEGCRQYRDMLRKYNLEDEDEH